MNAPECVLYDSAEAARFQTGLSAWVDRHGHIWGADEHTARYAGATHQRCEGADCGAIIGVREKLCARCRAVRWAERWEAMPQTEWDGICYLHIAQTDHFFQQAEDVIEHCFTHDIDDVRGLHLVLTRPNHLSEFDPSELLRDALPEDAEFEDVAPPAVVRALEALNQAIRDHADHAISWSPIAQRCTDAFLADLQHELDAAREPVRP